MESHSSTWSQDSCDKNRHAKQQQGSTNSSARIFLIARNRNSKECAAVGRGSHSRLLMSPAFNCNGVLQCILARAPNHFLHSVQ